jgi:Skp family chaperone for outer membrane proteins
MTMKFLLRSTTILLIAAAAPIGLRAQPLPAPVAAVVNIGQIAQSCTACVAANQQLQGQGNALQGRAQALATQIDAEARALQPLVNALPAGGQPDAALGARIQAYQTMQQNADREITASRERLQRNAQFVEEQLGDRLRPAINTVMQQRGATLVFDRRALIDASPTLDITAAVLAIVNQNAAALNVNAPPPQPAGAAPAGTAPRPTAPPATTPTRPRPQGR